MKTAELFNAKLGAYTFTIQKDSGFVPQEHEDEVSFTPFSHKYLLIQRDNWPEPIKFKSVKRNGNVTFSDSRTKVERKHTLLWGRGEKETRFEGTRTKTMSKLDMIRYLEKITNKGIAEELVKVLS